MLWVVLVIGMIAGGFGGGFRSLRLARHGALSDASRLAKRSALVAGVCGAALTVPTLGWPFQEVTVSVPEEVLKAVVETVEVPVRITRWFFWTTTGTETREVSRDVWVTVNRTGASRVFSFWLLIPMIAVGLLCYYVEKWCVQVLWRWLA